MVDLPEDQNPRELAYTFEATKLSLDAQQSGDVLVLRIHPNDLPQELYEDWGGTRYMVAMVKLDHHDFPAPRREVIEGKRAVTSAAMLCRDYDFQVWIYQKGYALSVGEHDAAEGLRKELGIISRADLRTNAKARGAFDELKERFLNESGHGR
jgi:hypothetical protein